MFVRSILDIIRKRINEPISLIQTLLGPRQVGKTTLVKQLIETVDMPFLYISADNIANADSIWLIQQWEIARMKEDTEKGFLLIIDEIQKVRNWSETIKQLWDEDRFKNRNIKVVILGSAGLLIQQGLTESLTGRFEIINISHWSYAEVNAAFGLTADEFIWFGGYPGAINFISEENRFKDYVRNALIETTISKDILMLSRVDKPALLKRVFELGTFYSSQIISYTKLLGQLQDAGNTTTLSHYLSLLDHAGVICGIEKIYQEPIRVKSSSPKFQVKNTAYISSMLDYSLPEIKSNPESWGRIVESAIGAHLINFSIDGNYQVHYWKERNLEVDFVLRKGTKIIGIEVKSGAAKPTSGMREFKNKYKDAKVLLVGTSGIPYHDFLNINPVSLF